VLRSVPRVLLTWVGDNDVAATTDAAKGIGPIAAVVRERVFDRIVLLTNRPESWASAFVAWLRPQTQAAVELRHLPLKDPTDHEAIFHAVRPVLEELKSQPVKLTVHLSPGTPSMHAVWLLLCKTQFPAELVRASIERGVLPANVPFEIHAELTQDILRAPAEMLMLESLALAPEDAAFSTILYKSREMREVIRKAQRVAAWPVHVLIEGETGTGKELFARAIHEASPRKGKPFEVLNCGAIPKEMVEAELFGYERGAFTDAKTAYAGAFVRAHEGTLFLDELGELPLEAQVKLLRAVEYNEVRPLKGNMRKVDVRILAATHRSLSVEIADGRFREDLFYRISTMVLRLPPLRERQADISLLLDHALTQANEIGSQAPGYEHKKFSPGARNLLQTLPWPGNVRELVGTVLRAAIWSEGAAIGTEDARRALLGAPSPSTERILHRPLGDGLDLGDILAEVSRHYMERALEATGGVKKDAATLLGFSNHQTFSNWMGRYGVKP
jgi:DNA-binding NtrC family response regulator